jgi:hypothetical protein
LCNRRQQPINPGGKVGERFIFGGGHVFFYAENDLPPVNDRGRERVDFYLLYDLQQKLRTVVNAPRGD